MLTVYIDWAYNECIHFGMVCRCTKVYVTFSVCLFQGLTAEEENRLEWIITTPFEKDYVSKESFLSKHLGTNEIVLEFGPRYKF